MNQDFLPANTILHPENFTGPGASRFRENYIPTDPNTDTILDNAYRFDVGVYLKAYLEWMDGIPHMATRFHHLDVYQNDLVDEYGNAYLGPSTGRYGIPDYFPDEWMESIDGQNFINPSAEDYGYAGPVFIQGAWGLAPIYHPDGTGRGTYKWTFFKEANSADWIDMNGESSKEFRKQPESSTWFPRKYSVENYDKGFLYYAPAAVEFEIAGFDRSTTTDNPCGSVAASAENKYLTWSIYQNYLSSNYANNGTGAEVIFSGSNGHFIPNGDAQDADLYSTWDTDSSSSGAFQVDDEDGNPQSYYGHFKVMEFRVPFSTIADVNADPLDTLEYRGIGTVDGSYGVNLSYFRDPDAGDPYDTVWRKVKDAPGDGGTIDINCPANTDTGYALRVVTSTLGDLEDFYDNYQMNSSNMNYSITTPLKLASMRPAHTKWSAQNRYDTRSFDEVLGSSVPTNVPYSSFSHIAYVTNADGDNLITNDMALDSVSWFPAIKFKFEPGNGWYEASYSPDGPNITPLFETLNNLNNGALIHMGDGLYGFSENGYAVYVQFSQNTVVYEVVIQTPDNVGEVQYAIQPGAGSGGSYTGGLDDYSWRSLGVFQDNYNLQDGEFPTVEGAAVGIVLTPPEPQEARVEYWESQGYSMSGAVEAMDNPVISGLFNLPNEGDGPSCEMLAGWDGATVTVPPGHLMPSGTVNGTMADYYNDLVDPVSAEPHPYSSCAEEQKNTMRDIQLATFFQLNADNDDQGMDACCFLHVQGAAATDIFSPVDGEMKFQWGTTDGHGGDARPFRTGPFMCGSNKLMTKTSRGQPDFFSTHDSAAQTLSPKNDLFELKVSAEGTKLILKAVAGAWDEHEFDLINDYTLTSYNKPEDIWDIPCEDYSGFHRGDGSSSFYDGHSTRLRDWEIRDEELVFECAEEGSRFPGICLRFQTDAHIFLVSIAFRGEVVSHTTNLDLFGENVKMMAPRYRGGAGYGVANHDWIEPVYLPKNQP